MNELTVQQNIEHKIFTIRGVQVMIDRDLAELYGVEPKRLGEQVKRNIERFPDEFRFQLTEDEKNELVANCDRLQPLKHSSSLPYVFTEQGVSMLSAVLRSDTAIQTSINIINSFVKMRKYLLQNASLFQRVEKLELDIKKYNAQYGNLRAVEFANSHDRFLIIDAREIYHIGASLKDLGKKWFAFSLLEVESFGLMERVRKVVGDE